MGQENLETLGGLCRQLDSNPAVFFFVSVKQESGFTEKPAGGIISRKKRKLTAPISAR